jgi:hypothetical protein
MVDDHQNANRHHRVKDITDGQRQAIYEVLLERSNRWKLKRNITSVWDEAKNGMPMGNQLMFP